MRALSLALLAALAATASPAPSPGESPPVAARADYPPAEKLPPRPELPDPLLGSDGKPVTTAKQWFEQRRPELRDQILHYMYGPIPAAPARTSAAVEHTDPGAFGGKATLQEIALTVGPPGAPKIRLLLAVPNARKGPVGVFVGPNFGGNHTLVADPKVKLPTAWTYPSRKGVTKDGKATEEGRGTQIDVWAIEQTIDRGWATATFYNGDVDPDRKEERGGLRPYLSPKDTGTVSAWAWGVHRAVDYLTTRPELDAKKVVAVGHSRLGKTVLLAAATDDRIALAIPHQAGCGGTAPSRGKVGESVTRINTSFPHWFNANFKQFNDRPERLPFDQHSLTALVAPRPVLFSNAVEDTWANPDGQFEVLKAAQGVYKLLGAGGLKSDKVPPVEVLSDGTLGYYIRPGKHSMTPGDWKVFVDFAEAHLGKAGAPRKAAARGRKVLLVGQGPDGHPAGTHEYVAGLKVLAAALKGVPGLEVIEVRADGAWKEGPELLARVDGAVLFVSEGARWMGEDPARLRALQALATRGGGLTVLHWGMGTKDAGPVAACLDLVGGCHGGPDRKYKVLETAVKPADHPATCGLAPFPIRDEFYYRLKLADKGVRPVAYAGIEGKDEVVAWAYERPAGGRGFGFSGLHFHENWKRDEYRRLVTGGVLWSLGVPPEARRAGAPMRPTVVAHRGLAGPVPENTLAAFRACAGHGLGVELDVRRAKDGTLVVLHDEDLRRTTDGAGPVAGVTLAELKRRDAGAKAGPAFAGERVPTWAEVCTLLEGTPGIPLVAVDLKVTDETLAADVVREARARGVLSRLVFIGLAIENGAVRRALRGADPAAHVARLAQTADDLPAALADADSDWAYVRFLPTAEQVGQAHRSGKKVFLVGKLVAGREPDNWARGRDAGVDALLTDHGVECQAAWRK